jgi:predicted Zn-dependent protease
MQLKSIRSYWVTLLIALGICACATSPLGRKQFMLVPGAQMDQMGAQAFEQMKTQEKIDTDLGNRQYVHCAVDPVLSAAERAYAEGDFPKNWEVVVFQSDSVNAFALPGGKIGVYTGLLGVAKTDAQLAAVLGHEIGHVIAHHGAERLSHQLGTQIGLAAIGDLAKDNPNHDLLMGILGLGTQVGVLLPFSRTQEGEADLIGLKLMAQAGFDPAQSVELWKNMMAASGGKSPPEVLSTHPASENRIQALQEKMPQALVSFRKAQSEGRHPKCDRIELRVH